MEPELPASKKSQGAKLFHLLNQNQYHHHDDQQYQHQHQHQHRQQPQLQQSNTQSSTSHRSSVAGKRKPPRGKSEHSTKKGKKSVTDECRRLYQHAKMLEAQRPSSSASSSSLASHTSHHDVQMLQQIQEKYVEIMILNPKYAISKRCHSKLWQCFYSDIGTHIKARQTLVPTGVMSVHQYNARLHQLIHSAQEVFILLSHRLTIVMEQCKEDDAQHHTRGQKKKGGDGPATGIHTHAKAKNGGRTRTTDSRSKNQAKSSNSSSSSSTVHYQSLLSFIHICIGDLNRYLQVNLDENDDGHTVYNGHDNEHDHGNIKKKDRHNNNDRSIQNNVYWEKALVRYYLALDVDPGYGKAHNQLSILFSSSSSSSSVESSLSPMAIDHAFRAIYQCLRATTATTPFSARENLVNYYELNRRMIHNLEQQERAAQRVQHRQHTQQQNGRRHGRHKNSRLPRHNHSYQPRVSSSSALGVGQKFLLRFVRLYGILDTKIGLDALAQLYKQCMQDFDALLETRSLSATLLLKLLVFSLHYIVTLRERDMEQHKTRLEEKKQKRKKIRERVKEGGRGGDYDDAMYSDDDDSDNSDNHRNKLGEGKDATEETNAVPLSTLTRYACRILYQIFGAVMRHVLSTPSSNTTTLMAPLCVLCMWLVHADLRVLNLPRPTSNADTSLHRPCPGNHTYHNHNRSNHNKSDYGDSSNFNNYGNGGGSREEDAIFFWTSLAQFVNFVNSPVFDHKTRDDHPSDNANADWSDDDDVRDAADRPGDDSGNIKHHYSQHRGKPSMNVISITSNRKTTDKNVRAAANANFDAVAGSDLFSFSSSSRELKRLRGFAVIECLSGWVDGKHEQYSEQWQINAVKGAASLLYALPPTSSSSSSAAATSSRAHVRMRTGKGGGMVPSIRYSAFPPRSPSVSVLCESSSINRNSQDDKDTADVIVNGSNIDVHYHHDNNNTNSNTESSDVSGYVSMADGNDALSLSSIIQHASNNADHIQSHIYHRTHADMSHGSMHDGLLASLMEGIDIPDAVKEEPSSTNHIPSTTGGKMSLPASVMASIRSNQSKQEAQVKQDIIADLQLSSSAAAGFTSVTSSASASAVSPESSSLFLPTGSDSNNSNSSKPLIVLDAPNISMRHGKGKGFSVKGLAVAIEYYQQRGHKVVAFVPDCYLDYEYVGRKKRMVRAGFNVAAAKMPDNVSLLISLHEEGVVVGTPAQDYDDSYCIEYAKRHSAYILTNDRYRDHIETLSSNEEKRQVRQWLKTHLITFSFVFDDLLPNPDFRFLSE